VPIDPRLVERLYRSKGERWRVSIRRFAEALEASVERAFAGRQPQPGEVDAYLSALHLEDLALASACMDGNEEAWEHFVLEQRPLLYRAADALDPTGGARDLADSLYADLFGFREGADARGSLFRYFHGRSSLTTWLRAVLAQRHVDRLRANRRMAPLPDEESPAAIPSPQPAIDVDRDRYLGLIQQALGQTIASLPPRDRLRLACYYSQEMTLAETGRILGEHEASSSRHLARTRRAIRAEVERRLRNEQGLTDPEIARCFECVTEDVGALDLRHLIDAVPERKESALDRSK
jgi:RNA polymerase sigma factor (sigma-70 family)